MNKAKLTSVKILEDLYKSFKSATVNTKMTLQKLTNRCVDLYLKDEEFKELADTDKLYIYSVLRKLLTLIYQVIRYPNVYPILLVQNYKSKQIIEKAFKYFEKANEISLNINK